MPIVHPRSASVGPVGGQERLWSFGRTKSATSWVYRPTTREEVADVFALARRRGHTIGLRGAGQSYGDVALNSDGIALDLSGLRRILAWDATRGTVRVEPGVTIGELWRYVVQDGWWPPVVPGTMSATIGGCAAANVHGKNAWRVGPIGEHVLEFELLLPSGEVRRCTPDDGGQLFHAAIGGIGMLGCFLTLTLQLRRVHSGLLMVRTWSAPDIAELIGILGERCEDADYAIGWVDGLARGRALGRGRVHAATHPRAEDDARVHETLRVSRQAPPRPLLGIVPMRPVTRLLGSLVNDVGVRTANAAVFRVGRLHDGRASRRSLARFAFPLDSFPDWPQVYGRGGLMEYQSFIPQAHAIEVFRAQLALAHERGLFPYAAALKRHRADRFVLTYGVDGFSLGLHFPVTAATRDRLVALAHDYDRIVVDAGGRLYFAKDGTTTADVVRRTLGAGTVEQFLRLKDVCDPTGRLSTDLFRRLFRHADA